MEPLTLVLLALSLLLLFLLIAQNRRLAAERDDERPRPAKDEETPTPYYRPILEAVQRRVARAQRVPVLGVRETGDGLKALGGTVSLVYARAGTGLLDTVRAAAQGDAAAAEAVQERLKKQHAHREEMPLAQAVAMAAAAPVIGELRYAGTVLHRAVFLPDDVDLAFTIFPYNGAGLVDDGFEFVEYVAQGTKERLEVLVLRSDPVLTDAERAAFEQLPTSQWTQNVGLAMDCSDHWTRAAVAAAVVVAAVVVTILLTCLCLASERRVHLTDEELARLGPALSARTLLAARRDYIAREGPWR